MNCEKCGANIKEGSLFCTECGTKVSLEKNAKIIVTRKKRALGFAIPFPLYIDGEKIGQLTNGKSIETEVTLGKHLVEFVCADGNVKQEVELTNEHNTVEVLCSARMGLIAAAISIQEVIYK